MTVSANISRFQIFIFGILFALLAPIGESNFLFAQNIAINTTGTAADANAVLDVSSTAQGMLIPRMTDAQRQALKTPATGLMIYNTTSNQLNYYSGTGWLRVPGNSVSTVSAGGAGPGGGISINSSGNAPDPSAILEIAATNKGLLVPRTTQGSVTAVTGMVIFNTSTNQINYWNGSAWQIPCPQTLDNTTGGAGATALGIAINSTGAAADPSAALDVVSATKGLLIPRMSSAQRDAIKTPATGLIIYNNTNNRIENWMGTAWYEWLAYPFSTAPTSISGTTTICSGSSTTLSVAGGSLSTPDASNGLVAYYKFESDLVDYSGSGLNLAGSGGSFTNGGLQLTTASSYTSASTSILNTDNYTISFYMKYSSTWDGTWRKIFGYEPAGSDRSPGLWKYPGSMNMHWRHDPANTGLAEAYTYNLGQWYYVTGVKNGSTFTLYVDETQVDAGTVANPKTAGAASLFFGGAPVVLREFKIFNRSLSATEVSLLGQWKWYSGSCGGTLVGSGPSAPLTPGSTTTYYVRGESPCNTTTCASVAVTVNTPPTAGTMSASVPTFLTGWTYRKNHLIYGAAGAGTNYQVQIKVYYGSGTDSPGSVYCNSHCKADFGDIRFTSSDGVTVYDCWMDPSSYVNASTATFWVEVGADLSSSQYIYLYYGNAAATTTSNGSNTFYFFDDFLGTTFGAGWTTAGSVTLDNSSTGVVTLNRNAGVDASLTMNTAFTATEPFAAEAKYQHPSVYRNRLYLTTFGGGGSPLGYDYGLFDSGSWWQNPGFWNGTWTYAGMGLNTWYIVKWEILTNNYNWVVSTTGGTELLRKSHGSHVNNCRFLSFSGTEGDASDSKLDWVRVRKYVSPEPANAPWGSEEGLPSVQAVYSGQNVQYTYSGGTGTFSYFEYQWNSTAGAWSGSWITANPGTWTSCCPGNTLYVRAVITSGACTTYSSPVAVQILPRALTYNYTGGVQYWVAPAGVTSFNVTAAGASGGIGNSVYYTVDGDPASIVYNSAAGGLGGVVTATYTTTPGTAYYIFPGAKGGDGTATSYDMGASAVAQGGGNGSGDSRGGNGGVSWYNDFGDVGYGYKDATGGGGGGASDIRVTPFGLANRILVAGGGGGGGCIASSNAGGAGGGTTGGNGSGSYFGYGGTQAAGGSGWACFTDWRGTNCWGDGRSGLGGDGRWEGYWAGSYYGQGGGGGGAGYYGGGGAGGSYVYFSGSGGGGSSYYSTGTSVTNTQGANSGNGYVTISW